MALAVPAVFHFVEGTLIRKYQEPIVVLEIFQPDRSESQTYDEALMAKPHPECRILGVCPSPDIE